jgi:DNA uptake protein ComE-like DNA-binding protein
MFIIVLILVFIAWLLWNICQNTNDALDKQTAIQYEIVSLEKRLEELLARFEKVSVSEPTPPSATSVDESKCSINHATVGELSSLPRIGKALAQRIVEHRPFNSVDELLKVQGISKEMLAEVRSKLTL